MFLINFVNLGKKNIFVYVGGIVRYWWSIIEVLFYKFIVGYVIIFFEIVC